MRLFRASVRGRHGNILQHRPETSHFYAAVFLVAVAAVPYLITGSTAGTFIFAISGTGALIIVHIILDVYRKTKERIGS